MERATMPSTTSFVNRRYGRRSRRSLSSGGGEGESGRNRENSTLDRANETEDAVGGRVAGDGAAERVFLAIEDLVLGHADPAPVDEGLVAAAADPRVDRRAI